MQSPGCKRCPHCPGDVRTYSVVHNNTWLHTLGRTQLHTVWLKVSTMVAQCCTQPPAVLGVHTFGSRWCLGLNPPRLASQLFHFYCKRPQPPRPQVEGWKTVLKLGRPTLQIFSPPHNQMCHKDQVENILGRITVSDAIAIESF